MTGPSINQAANQRLPPQAAAETGSLAELLSGVISDAQLLIHREIDLARREVTIEIDKARQGLTVLGIGAGVALLAAFLLAQMAVYALNEATGLALWLSYLIVGAVFAIIGGIALAQGIKRLKQVDPVPRETIESIRKDVTWITEQNPSDKT